MMRIVFLGTGDIGVPTLRRLLASPGISVPAVVTQPDKPAGRKQELLASAIKTLALEHGLPVLQPRKIREPAALEEVRAFEPDLIVVMAYGQLLPKALLEMPKVACLNLHASLLPRHRGAAPIQAAIEAGDRESGVAVMHMAEGLDTGDVLLAHRLPIRRRETGGSLHDRLGLIAPDALTEALHLLAEGQAPRTPQNESLATYAPKLTREHGAIGWSDGWLATERKIRAMNPWPSAYTWLPGGEAPRKLKVFSVIVHRRHAGPPGEVLRADRHGLLVGTGDGALLLRDVQLEGKRRMTAREFLQGHAISAGTRFS
ncbi:MAG TPA: methionyl-tRNA formyltransferase [Chthoniobacteraceae bacterium]|jgi:methionyl-tRNA formyltransferase|nr:methionyl-tRNA formyltransferase [Chthoniobacteraceae bacterium]